MVEALRISLQVTAVAAVLVGGVGLTLALWLQRVPFRGKLLVETLITLPLVLPPSVVGYFLLLGLGWRNPLVRWLHLDVLFTWPAAAIAAAVVGLPLMVQAARAALADVNPETEAAARVDGASEVQVLRYVTLPLARRGVITGLILGTARAFGEFGASLMVAGNIPGRTQTLPMAIYDAVQMRDYAGANAGVVVATSVAFLALWLARHLERGRPGGAARPATPSPVPLGAPAGNRDPGPQGLFRRPQGAGQMPRRAAPPSQAR